MEWLRVTEAAKYLGVTRTTLYQWMADGRLPYHKLETGGGRRLLRADLDALLTRVEEEPPD